jgi:prophage regulatory protein
MEATQTTPDRILRDDECHQLTGLKKQIRYKLEAEGKFPLRRRITERLSGYSYHEVQAWIDDRLCNSPRIEYTTTPDGRVLRTA